MANYNIVWFRNDLRIEKHPGLLQALQSNNTTIPLFIFDDNILSELPKNDARVTFIYRQLSKMNDTLSKYNSSIKIEKGNPLDIWKNLVKKYQIDEVYMAEDFEPYAKQRDDEVKALLYSLRIKVNTIQNQLLISPSSVLKKDKNPYTVFTPYAKKWKQKLRSVDEVSVVGESLFKAGLWQEVQPFPTLKELGFTFSHIQVPEFDISTSLISNYGDTRNNPNENTSGLGPYLRFGVLDIREVYLQSKKSEVFVNELIWREFFKQILYYFPNVVYEEFRPKYRGLPWKNDPNDFYKWKQGETGYPLVDAGMRQLNATGFMHNRVRMLTASFLVKHLLIDWRLGEAYFAQKLLDYDLSANNGNWQWAAGTGCDAAPYFRVFNPITQQQKFDPNGSYVKKWIPELGTSAYPVPMVDHKFARERALEFYKKHTQ